MIKIAEKTEQIWTRLKGITWDFKRRMSYFLSYQVIPLNNKGHVTINFVYMGSNAGEPARPRDLGCAMVNIPWQIRKGGALQPVLRRRHSLAVKWNKQKNSCISIPFTFPYLHSWYIDIRLSLVYSVNAECDNNSTMKRKSIRIIYSESGHWLLRKNKKKMLSIY